MVVFIVAPIVPYLREPQARKRRETPDFGEDTKYRWQGPQQAQEQARGQTTGTGSKGKTAVMGLLERGSTGIKVRVKVVENTKKKIIQSEVREDDTFRYAHRSGA